MFVIVIMWDSIECEFLYVEDFVNCKLVLEVFNLKLGEMYYGEIFV